ncbi:unnamed protein product [Miscanthus lutarioriparius]|uniref:Uncharacterized protein n=1 Tax=Miscanthus lutarioriparius TaxID=422564 RepID=A0A811QQ62_9POAL|nr:unnamed protein product [Miscanthus lutarioriparius]
MLQVRASPTFLPSTTSSSSPPSSSQAPTPFPFSGKSQRRGGLVAVPSTNRVARRSVIMAAAVAAKLEDADALIDSVETFIFDCDGQIPHRSPPASWVVGVCRAYCLNWRVISACAAQGKRLVFVTNNSTKSRKQYGKKFETLGMSIDEEEIFASSFAAAAYLQSIDFPKDKKVGAVVVGFDRYFNYHKVQYGTLCIRENTGCLFIATNRDVVTHLTDAQEWAGVTSLQTLQSPDNSIQTDFYTNQLSDFLNLKAATV